MRKIVFDIETVGCDFDALDDFSKEYMLKFADTPQKIEEAKASTSFYPLISEIIVIAMSDADSGKSLVYFQNGNGPREKFTTPEAVFVSGSEEEILRGFWRQIENADQLITFNGRMFDGPFVMLRSAIHSIRTVKNLVPYRYSPGLHVDLADQMTFYDAMRRRFPLHMWCQAFGIASPKAEGMNGSKVKEFFCEGRYHNLATYCLADVVATRELYLYWEKYLRF